MGSSFTPMPGQGHLPVLGPSLVERQLNAIEMRYPPTEGNDCEAVSIDISSSAELQQVQQALAENASICFLQEIISAGAGELGSPFIEITAQPQSRGYRFRYKCEGQSHGGIQADGSGREGGARMHPSIAIHNFHGSRARVSVSLVTAEDPARPHAHELIGKHCSNGRFSQEVYPQPNGSYNISFTGLSIQHATRKSIPSILKERLLEELQAKESYIPPLPVMPTEKQTTKAIKEAEALAKSMQLNAVRLKFEADMVDNSGVYHSTCALSQIVYDSKSTTANTLKISRIDRGSGSCIGGDEVFLLCSKVQKDDIKVKFFDVSEDGERCWQDFGTFSPADVHRQYAIVFRTPPYKDRSIREVVHVFMQLYRPSDEEESSPCPFMYFPAKSDQDEISRKRHKPGAPNFDDSCLKPRSAGQGGASGSAGASRGCSGSSFSAGTKSNDGPTSMQRPLNPSTGELMDSRGSGSFLADAAATVSAAEDIIAAASYSVVDNIGYRSDGSIVKTEREGPQFEAGCGQPHLNPDQPQQFQQLIDMLLRHPQLSSLSQDSQLCTDSEPCDLPVTLMSVDDNSKTGALAPVASANALLARRASSLPNGIPAEPVLLSPAGGLLAPAPGQSSKDSSIAAMRNYACSGDIRFLIATMQELAAAQDDAGDNSVHLAVIHNQKDALLSLLSASRPSVARNQALNQRNDDGQTPLHIATILGLPTVAALLLQYGADTSLCDYRGNTCWHIAANSGDSRMLSTIASAGVALQHSGVNCLNYEGFSPLHLAVKGRNYECVTQLLESGADVHITDGKCGRSALHLAVENKCLDIVTYFITTAGADIDQPRFDGNTALHIASCLGLTDVVTLLVAAGADTELENYEAQDDECDMEMASELSGELANRRRRGRTPLDLAGDDEKIRSLLKCSPTRRPASDSEAGKEMTEPHAIPRTIEDLDSATRSSLVAELDSSPHAWARLADAVGLGQLVSRLRTSKSPASSLLDNYEVLNGTIEDLRSQMKKLNMNKAVSILDGSKIGSEGRLDSGVGTSLSPSDSFQQASWGIRPSFL